MFQGCSWTGYAWFLEVHLLSSPFFGFLRGGGHITSGFLEHRPLSMGLIWFYHLVAQQIASLKSILVIGVDILSSDGWTDPRLGFEAFNWLWCFDWFLGRVLGLCPERIDAVFLFSEAIRCCNRQFKSILVIGVDIRLFSKFINWAARSLDSFMKRGLPAT